MLFGISSCQKETFTISFEDFDGSVETIEVTENSLIKEPTAPTREGYTFGGWYLNEECTGDIFDFTTFKVTDHITLYAKWIPNICTVTFVTNGGTAVNPVKVDYGKSLTAPANPTKEGYAFDRWFTDPTLTKPYGNTPITGDITLYAKWKSMVYYSGSLTGEGTYNPEDGTYSFILDFPTSWGRFTIFYNKEVISANDENLIITGLYNSSETCDWTNNFYCDKPENAGENDPVDYTTFINYSSGK